MTEEKIINAFLNGNDELFEDDGDDIDAAKMHEADKAKNANKRKANIKARKHKKAIPEDAVFNDKSAKAKKAYKRASAKANRRAREIVNSSRALHHKVYGDLDDKLKNYYK